MGEGFTISKRYEQSDKRKRVYSSYDSDLKTLERLEYVAMATGQRMATCQLDMVRMITEDPDLLNLFLKRHEKKLQFRLIPSKDLDEIEYVFMNL